VALDFSIGRTLLPNLITVTLTRPGTALAVTVANVQEQAERSGDRTGGSPALLPGTDTTYNLWSLDLGAVVPAKDDRITRADGRTFTVLGVDRCAHGARYRCHARKDVGS